MMLHSRYHYNNDGDLVKVTDSLGHSSGFQYITHLLVRETDRTGLSFYFSYDGLGKMPGASVHGVMAASMITPSVMTREVTSLT